MDVGEPVLVMLPTDHNKLLLRWKGPYPIVEKVCLAEYRIKIGDQHRLFHVNMLRKYVDREPILCSVAAILDPVECPELEIEEEPEQGNESYHDVKIASELVGNPAWELRELLREYKEIFSDVPGLTKLEEHAITLNTTTAIRSKSYPVPFAKVTDIETDVKKMMTMGIIEPSKSPFCSPRSCTKVNYFQRSISAKDIGKFL